MTLPSHVQPNMKAGVTAGTVQTLHQACVWMVCNIKTPVKVSGPTFMMDPVQKSNTSSEKISQNWTPAFNWPFQQQGNHKATGGWGISVRSSQTKPLLLDAFKHCFCSHQTKKQCPWASCDNSGDVETLHTLWEKWYKQGRSYIWTYISVGWSCFITNKGPICRFFAKHLQWKELWMWCWWTRAHVNTWRERGSVRIQRNVQSRPGGSGDFIKSSRGRKRRRKQNYCGRRKLKV